MTDLAALIEKLEKATEGSRSLNGAIWKAVDPQAASIADCDVRAMGNRDWTKEEADRNAEIKLRRLAPPYTTSLDAALTLVPERFSPGVSHNLEQGIWDAWLMGRNGDREEWETIVVADAHHDSSAPLALCIAALKARAS